MEKSQRTKILTIIVLAIGVIAMSLGFAAFSVNLNVSSSATVTPNEEDFKIKIYGVKDNDSLNDFGESGYIFDERYLSDTIGVASINGDNMSAETAVIDNKNHAYIDLSEFIDDSVVSGMYKPTCVGDEGATETLVDAACNGLNLLFTIIDKKTGDGKTITDSIYKIPVNSDELFAFIINYEGPFPDGKFEATFPNIELKFSTAK